MNFEAALQVTETFLGGHDHDQRVIWELKHNANGYRMLSSSAVYLPEHVHGHAFKLRALISLNVSDASADVEVGVRQCPCDRPQVGP